MKQSLQDKFLAITPLQVSLSKAKIIWAWAQANNTVTAAPKQARTSGIKQHGPCAQTGASESAKTRPNI